MAAIVAFCGPSLPPAQAQAALPGGEILGPAARGDVYRVARQSPDAIVLIDGYFEHQLSVWHKEILWALSRGVRVYGAASMGALRAAELYPFGMVGVGLVFKLYRDGVFEEDDAVAVAHESAERGYWPKSVALVNIFCSLRAAVSAGAMAQDAAAVLLGEQRDLFYPEREWPAAGFERIDQKRLDALAALELAGRDAASGQGKPQPFHFEHTECFHGLARLE